MYNERKALEEAAIIKKEEESEQKISDEQAREWGWID